MPANLSRGLSILGSVFGIVLFSLSVKRRAFLPARRKTCELLLVAGFGMGGILLLGIVAGVYRPCPFCALIWSFVTVACLAVVASGGAGGRLMTLAFTVFTLAAGWTRLDRTTALGLANVMPHIDLSADCVADVLTKNDLRALRTLGMPEGTPVIFVARCSPCASATLKRIVDKSPALKVVADDTTLAPLLGSGRLIVYPILKERAKGLKGNLYKLTVEGGEVRECRSNASSFE